MDEKEERDIKQTELPAVGDMIVYGGELVVVFDVGLAGRFTEEEAHGLGIVPGLFGMLSAKGANSYSLIVRSSTRKDGGHARTPILWEIPVQQRY